MVKTEDSPKFSQKPEKSLKISRRAKRGEWGESPGSADIFSEYFGYTSLAHV